MNLSGNVTWSIEDQYKDTIFGRNRESLESASKTPTTKAVTFQAGTDTWRKRWSKVVAELQPLGETSFKEQEKVMVMSY